MPTPAIDQQHWNATLWKLCQAHGTQRVYEIGLAELGFPPQWAVSGTEIGLVVRAVATAVQNDTRKV
jgi:hypothetical protein